MTNVKSSPAVVLRELPTVITRALFWKIPHRSGREDIALKIGRYKRLPDRLGPELLETENPRSALTLDNEETKALIKYLQDSYEPFRLGVNAFIPLDRPYDDESAERIKAFFSHPENDLIDFILAREIIPEHVEVALQQARRLLAIREFEHMLQDNDVEQKWQVWFTKNDWVLGSEFVRIIDERHIDTKHISDFLMQAYDGFLDIIEIKRPEGGLTFWDSNLDHGNYVPSAALTKAITQSQGYLFEIEREANSNKFFDNVGSIKTVKPRCTLIFGRSYNWNEDQVEAYRILNAGYHSLTILTYDHVLRRAKRMVGIDS